MYTYFMFNTEQNRDKEENCSLLAVNVQKSIMSYTALRDMSCSQYDFPCSIIIDLGQYECVHTCAQKHTHLSFYNFSLPSICKRICLYRTSLLFINIIIRDFLHLVKQPFPHTASKVANASILLRKVKRTSKAIACDKPLNIFCYW